MVLLNKYLLKVQKLRIYKYIPVAFDELINIKYKLKKQILFFYYVKIKFMEEENDSLTVQKILVIQEGSY